MRVTQQSMYTSMLYGMNTTLADYMESNLQSSTQKRINRPSDDPAGMAHILTYRDSITKTEQYETNSDAAEGWLTASMAALDSVSSIITEIKTQAELGASATNAEQREIIAATIREHMGTLMNLANERHPGTGESLFAGQNYEETAFDMGLGVTSNTDGLNVSTITTVTDPNSNITTEVSNGTDFTIKGSIDEDTIVRFVATDPPANPAVPFADITLPPVGVSPDNDVTYEYSEDGGKTWETGRIKAGQPEQPGPPIVESTLVSSFKVGDATLSVPTGVTATVTPYDPEQLAADDNGTQLHLRQDDVTFQVDGSLDKSAMVRFPPVDPNADPPDLTPVRLPLEAGADPIKYEWTEDGGETWNEGIIKAGDTSFEVGTAILNIPEGQSTVINPYDPRIAGDSDNGTELVVRPTAIYNGYDEKSEPTVDRYGAEIIPSTIGTKITGTLSKDVLIEFPKEVDMTVEGLYEYSYSTDGGQTWKTGEAEVEATYELPLATPPVVASSSMRVIIAGGYMDMHYDGALDSGIRDSKIPAGAQLIVKPQRTELEFEITEDEYMGVTNVGKNIFGGMHSTNGSDDLEPMYDGDGRNLFETVGRLIGALETNDSAAIAESIAELTEAHKTVTTEATRIGGKSNRLDVNIGLLDSKKFNQNSRLSGVEDVNISDLMVKLAQQKTAYNSVLQSSSQIMQISLLNYL